jgi:hypothetical protein
MPFRIVDDDKIAVVDNYFVKTRANILAGSSGSLLFITDGMKTYQVKGRLEYLTSGDLFDEMRQAVDAKHPRAAVVLLHADEVYSGAEKVV